MTLRFFSGDLGETYAIYLRLIGRPIVDFLFVLIELYSLGVTAEVLEANINWKSAFLRGWFSKIFT